MHDGYAKSILRDAMRGIAPDHVLDERRKTGFNASIEELIEKEKIENSNDEAGQQLDATFALADRILTNDSTLDALAAKLHAAIEDYLELANPKTLNDSEE